MSPVGAAAVHPERFVRVVETGAIISRMTSRQRCYVASPLGFTEGGWQYYRGVYLPALSEVVDTVDPWRDAPDEWDPAASPLLVAASEDERRAVGLEIGRRNARDIERCPWLVAYLEGQEPDAGTVVEVGYAAGLGKTCFALRSDARESGEPGMRLSLQVESIIVSTGGAVYRTLAELLGGLRAHLPAPRSDLSAAS